MYIQAWETNVALPYALISQYTCYSSVLGTMHSVKQRIPDHENHYHFSVTQGAVNFHNVKPWNVETVGVMCCATLLQRYHFPFCQTCQRIITGCATSRYENMSLPLL